MKSTKEYVSECIHHIHHLECIHCFSHPAYRHLKIKNLHELSVSEKRTTKSQFATTCILRSSCDSVHIRCTFIFFNWNGATFHNHRWVAGYRGQIETRSANSRWRETKASSYNCRLIVLNTSPNSKKFNPQSAKLKEKEESLHSHHDG